MEEIIGTLITILISSGILGGAYIYFKDKLRYIGEIVTLIGETLIYLHQALDDDVLSKDEIKQLVTQLENLYKMLIKVVRVK